MARRSWFESGGLFRRPTLQPSKRDLAHTLDAVANQMQVVAGLTIELRRSIGGGTRFKEDV